MSRVEYFKMSEERKQRRSFKMYALPCQQLYLKIADKTLKSLILYLNIKVIIIFAVFIFYLHERYITKHLLNNPKSLQIITLHEITVLTKIVRTIYSKIAMLTKMVSS